MARSKIDIDWSVVDEKLSKFCEGHEVAAFLGISYKTLERAVRDKFGMLFIDYKAQKRSKGEVLLRELQWNKAAKGDTAMQIFLGKQYLGQSDRQIKIHELPETSTFSITFRNGDKSN